MDKIKTISILFLLFALDITSKIFIINKLPQNGVYLFPQIGFEFHKNYGIAFGIAFYNIFIIILSIIIIIFLIISIKKISRDKKYPLCFFIGLIIIGAISNLIDRILYGYVIDFFVIWIFPVFNLSDIYIVFGIIFSFFLLNKKSPTFKDGGINQ
ncbi:MAG TPA: signal peptidase II [bacterium]|jgi:signal peptidase II|nr:signal peptidase II [bacterium]HOG38715.1 signal peptidase II [bacterium]HQI03568.1 signal peptidase II [bacterium]